MQGLFVLTVAYVGMTIYPLEKHYYLYTVSCRYKRDYLHASIDILFYIMFYIINTMKKH